MIRIMRIINRFNLGGPTYNAAYLTKYLDNGYETLLVGGQQDKSEADSDFILKELGIQPVRIQEMKREISPFLDFQAFSKLKKMMRDFNPHIVHTHASKAGALGRMAANQLKVPVKIHTFHGHIFDEYFSRLRSNFYVRLERQLAGITDSIITLSENQKNDIVKKYRICPSSKAAVIPLGFDLSRFQIDYEVKRKSFRDKYGLKDDEIAIGIIGRLVPVKNHELFINAIEHLLKNSERKIRAFIVGDGEYRNYITNLLIEKKISYTNGYEGGVSVTFTSWQKDVDIINAGLDIVALTSLNEGTPVSLIEAQAAGNPVVTTNVGGIQNIVLNNVTGLIAEKGNDDDFIMKLQMLVEDDDFRNSLSGKGWEFVSGKFHYSRLVSDVSELYQTLLKKKL